MRLNWKIDVPAFEQAGYEIGLEMKRTESKFAPPGTGSGHCRMEDGRRLAGDAAGRRDGRGGRRSATEAGSGRRTVGGEERFRGPETHRRIVSGNRNGPGPGGLDCGKAVMRCKTYSSAGLNGEAKSRAGRGAHTCAAASSVARREETGPSPLGGSRLQARLVAAANSVLLCSYVRSDPGRVTLCRSPGRSMTPSRCSR